MKSNSDKWHLLLTTDTSVSISINGFNITNSIEEHLLGFKFDRKLCFEHRHSILQEQKPDGKCAH